MDVDRLIQGHPYTYTRSGESFEVLYDNMIKLYNGDTAYHFKLRHGYVNLSKDLVEETIH